jgi:hypothetical protein
MIHYVPLAFYDNSSIFMIFNSSILFFSRTAPPMVQVPMPAAMPMNKLFLLHTSLAFSTLPLFFPSWRAAFGVVLLQSLPVLSGRFCYFLRGKYCI